MTTIIICEGIPTSGKSLVIKHLKEQVKQPVKQLIYKYMQFADKQITAKEATQHLLSDLQNALKENPQTILIHNFHLFFAIKSKQDNLEAFKSIEEELKKHNTVVVYLELQGRIILKTFDKTLEERKQRGEDCSFTQYREKLGTRLQQLANYTVVQDKYNKLSKLSLLNIHRVKITKETSYEDVIKEIIAKSQNINDFLAFSKD